MMSSASRAALQGLRPGNHVCWVVSEPTEYGPLAAALLAQARLTHEKPVLFGPAGPARDALAGSAAASADPRTTFPPGTPLVPSLLVQVFEEQAALATTQGYRGLRLVADMDWLLPLRPTPADVLALELLLDRSGSALGATMVCLYRTASFAADTLAAAACVHPISLGHAPAPPFRLVAGRDRGWRLLGDVDVTVEADFRVAIETAVAAGPCVVDASDLELLDVHGMRHLAEAARRHATPVRVVGARAVVPRSWRSAGFGELAPSVEFSDQSGR